jgi:hypothetical protein
MAWRDTARLPLVNIFPQQIVYVVLKYKCSGGEFLPHQLRIVAWQWLRAVLADLVSCNVYSGIYVGKVRYRQ